MHLLCLRLIPITGTLTGKPQRMRWLFAYKRINSMLGFSKSHSTPVVREVDRGSCPTANIHTRHTFPLSQYDYLSNL